MVTLEGGDSVPLGHPSQRMVVVAPAGDAGSHRTQDSVPVVGLCQGFHCHQHHFLRSLVGWTPKNREPMARTVVGLGCYRVRILGTDHHPPHTGQKADRQRSPQLPVAAAAAVVGLLHQG